ncbi:helicase HerA-like domain-containing protein [Sanguibacter antarcticus]|nr:helicase HerA-like domain-containing protein [Sanguibacter antarcticus]
MVDDDSRSTPSTPATGAPDLLALRAAAAHATAEAAEARAAATRAALAAAEAADAAGTPEVAEQAEPPAVPEPAALSQHAASVRAAYAGSDVLPLGVLLEGDAGGTVAPVPSATIGLPLSMLTRHGLVAGATGTGKTRTLQLMTEGLSRAGVPVFVTDIKGDLSGLAVAGEPSEKLLARAASIGQAWSPASVPVEVYSLGGLGTGVPVRTTVTDMGPLLLSKVLGLNETQESSLGLVFYWADRNGLALLDLTDLQTTIAYLLSDDGKAELKAIGGLSTATAGVILREIVTLQAQGGDVFFGEPAFSTADLVRTTDDGAGIVSALELPEVHDRPALFSTFLMWLLADLFHDMPEVGDVERPRLVFFFDEAHLLFTGASPAFLAQVVQTVRLVRSKGVGIVFVTQSPKDIPSDVLAQLGNRVQHALRAFTPDDAAALRAAVRTYPTSSYDLAALLQSLGTGEAVVTVLDEHGVPSPVAWTRVCAPTSSMRPAPDATLAEIVAASPLRARYAERLDPESAHEVLTARARTQEADDLEDRQTEELEQMQERLDAEAAAARERTAAPRRSSRSGSSGIGGGLDAFLRSAGSALGREITRSVFGTRRR